MSRPKRAQNAHLGEQGVFRLVADRSRIGDGERNPGILEP
jgi:hypothetical protein